MNFVRNKQLKQNSSGFNFFELIVAIVIMAVLTTIILANYSQGNKRRALALGADTVSNSLRVAQNSSLNPSPIAGSACDPDNVPGEYSIKFNTSNPTSYTMIAYFKCGTPPANTVLQTFTLPRNVRLKVNNGLVLGGVGVGAGGGTLEIKYATPFSKVTASLNGGAYQSFNQANIILESSDTEITKTVILSGVSGRVDVQ